MTSMRLRIAAAIFLLALSVPAAAEAAGRWTHLGPYGGPVSDIAIAPTAHRTLYAATVSGVYRSDDVGARWRPVRRGLPQYVGALAVDPTDARIVYVSALAREAGDPLLYKTVDGGATWASLDLEGMTAVEDIAIDPRDPSTLLAAGDGGLFRSADAGATWDRVGPDLGTIAPLFENVAFAPETPGVAYAASGNYGFFKSTDGGRTWTAKNEQLPAGAGRLGVSSSGALYATPGDSSGAVYRSLDQGESWTLLGSIHNQAIYALAVSADGVVYAGTGQGIYRKNATGPGWTALRPGKREEIRALAVDPEDDGTLYAGIGTYGGFRGVLKSTDAGATWRQANQGLGGNFTTALAIAPGNPQVIYVSFSPWNIARSANGGATWRDVSPRETRIFELAVDPRNENLVYAVGEYGQFWRSTNGGRSWTLDEVEDGQCVSPTSLTLDPRDPDRLLLAGFTAVGCERGGDDSCHVLQSTDRGREWSCLEGARDADYYSLLADPRRSATLFAGGVGGFFKSTDGGQVWTPSNNGLSGGVLTLAVSPNGTLWAGGASVWKSRNGGTTWRPSGRGLPEDGQVRTLLTAPSNASVLYALVSLYDPALDALAYDIYVSSNAGASWRRVPERGLPPLDYFEVWAFQVDPRNPGRLYIGTHLGLFRLDGVTE